MEHITQTQQTLDRLRLRAEESPILPIVLPLFETLHYQDDYYPSRVTEYNGDAQLLWETGELNSSNFERLCLTLSKQTLSLTIALDHRHTTDSLEIPVIPRTRFETAMRSSMVIGADSHSLYETNRNNGVLRGVHYENEAINRFTPELTHTLAFIGLYGYGQNSEQEVG